MSPIPKRDTGIEIFDFNTKWLRGLSAGPRNSLNPLRLLALEDIVSVWFMIVLGTGVSYDWKQC